MTSEPEIEAGAGSSIAALGTAVRVTIVSVIALGLLYPAAVTILAAGLAPAQAAGSLIYSGSHIIGTENAGQVFTRPEYFHGRPSAAGNGYDPTQTGGTNLGPTSKKLIAGVGHAVAALRQENPGAGSAAIPAELVTSSASGIDPDISPAAAAFQAPRVARARRLHLEQIDILITRCTKPRLLGIFGEPHVNVLVLNRALDAYERASQNVPHVSSQSS